jgi:hypothetical protein
MCTNEFFPNKTKGNNKKHFINSLKLSLKLMNYCNLIPTIKINTKVLINNKFNEGLKTKEFMFE